MDLGTLWRARRWRKLLNLIDGLPRNSAYIEAVTSDEQWAAIVLGDPRTDRAPVRRMADWSPEMEQLTNLYDRVGELIRAVIAAAGGKPKRVPPAPRPVTALDWVRKRSREAKHRALVARVLPAEAAVSSTPAPAERAAVRPAGPGTEWLRRQHGAHTKRVGPSTQD